VRVNMSIRRGDALGGLDDEAGRQAVDQSPQVIDRGLAAAFVEMAQAQIEGIEDVTAREYRQVRRHR